MLFARYRSHGFDPVPYAGPQRLVNIGGRRLNVYCTGTGHPTVLLDAGLGGSTLSWRLVQPHVARSTRVCSYDRAGMGFSDPGPLPRTSSAIVADMHALVHRAGLGSPIVLVGHSLGAMNVRLYANRYPSDVAGMVLVDGSDEAERPTDLAISKASWDFEVSAPLARFRDCQVRATRKTLSHDDPNHCLPAPVRRFGDALNVQRRRLAEDPNLWATEASESASYDGVNRQQLLLSRRSYGSMPLVVLTRGTTSEEPGVSAAETARIEAALLRMHQGEAALSKRGVSRVVPASGHDIQLGQPGAVVDAIEEVLRGIVVGRDALKARGL